LVNDRSFCKVCSASCTDCRWKTNWSHVNMIAGIATVRDDLPQIVDDPETYVPENPPKSDLILSIGIHPDIASALPLLARRVEAKAVIVPVEDPKWMSLGLQGEIEKQLTEMGVESAFPKPFCSLDETGKPVIDSFIEQTKIGRPMMKVSLRGPRVSDTEVLRSSPCGCTWYIAEQIKNHPLKGLEERIALSHHSYPCTASMQDDPVLKEKILHKAGWMAREAVKQAIDEFVNAHPEYETELIQASLPTRRETVTTIPVLTEPAIEKDVKEGVH
jgi:hypothetical protein